MKPSNNPEKPDAIAKVEATAPIAQNATTVDNTQVVGEIAGAGIDPLRQGIHQIVGGYTQQAAIADAAFIQNQPTQYLHNLAGALAQGGGDQVTAPFLESLERRYRTSLSTQTDNGSAVVGSEDS